MLIQPTLESLMKKVDSKYTLVTLAAKRARELTDGDAPFVDVNTNKVVSVAMEEINEGKIKYETPQAGIKESEGDFSCLCETSMSYLS